MVKPGLVHGAMLMMISGWCQWCNPPIRIEHLLTLRLMLRILPPQVSRLQSTAGTAGMVLLIALMSASWTSVVASTLVLEPVLNDLAKVRALWA